MATILPFVSNKIDFDDEATRIMGEAFDAACVGLQETGQPALTGRRFRRGSFVRGRSQVASDKWVLPPRETRDFRGHPDFQNPE